MKYQTIKIVSLLIGIHLLSGIGNVYGGVDEDRARGIGWLLMNQNGDGSWGSGGAKVAATSEVLSALKKAGADHGFLYARAISWLANKKTDSVDSLARKIIALENSDVDTVKLGFIDRLLLLRNRSHLWGSYEGYDGGFPDSSLAMEAIRLAEATYSNEEISAYFNSIRQGQKSGDHGWSYMGGYPGHNLPQRIMPTAHNLVVLSEYSKLGWNYKAHILRGINWLIDHKRQSDGSFLDDSSAVSGVIHKTALAYLAIETAQSINVQHVNSNSALTNAKNYLLSQQSGDGSWGNDPYQTALVLQTLPQVSMNDSDGDGIPDSVEAIVNTDPNKDDSRKLVPGNGLDPDGIDDTPLTAPPILIELLLNQTISRAVPISGGTSGFSWTLAGGDIPDGVSVNPFSGTITGTAMSAGTYTFSLLVSDAAGSSFMVPGLIRVIDLNDNVTDSDHDGILSKTELLNGSNPLSIDSDHDGVLDGVDPYPLNTDNTGKSSDTDGDGMSDYWENVNGLDRHDANDASDDLDGDGLINLAEYHSSTDPHNSDTDGDSVLDYDEIQIGRNPTVNESAVLVPIFSLLL